MFQYVQGDLFDTNFDHGNHIIAHVTNNIGKWGAGFVIPLGKKYPEARNQYIINNQYIGKTQFVDINKHLIIANMCAQTLGGPRPLYYNELVYCMEDIINKLNTRDIFIHAPLFGAGLAGGNWFFIHELIKDIWTNINVRIYWMKNMLPPGLTSEMFDVKTGILGANTQRK